jgi:hypothetical protein
MERCTSFGSRFVQRVTSPNPRGTRNDSPRYLSNLRMRRNSAIRPNLLAQRAVNKRKWMNVTIRNQTRTRSVSSQSKAVSEEEIQNQVQTGISQRSKPNDLPTAPVLDLLRRVLGPRKHELWSSVVQRLQDDHGKRRCFGGRLPLSALFPAWDSPSGNSLGPFQL